MFHEIVEDCRKDILGRWRILYIQLSPLLGVNKKNYILNTGDRRARAFDTPHSRQACRGIH